MLTVHHPAETITAIGVSPVAEDVLGDRTGRGYLASMLSSADISAAQYTDVLLFSSVLLVMFIL